MSPAVGCWGVTSSHTGHHESVLHIFVLPSWLYPVLADEVKRNSGLLLSW